MKKNILYAAAFMAVVLAGCSQEEQLGMNNEVKSGFIGTMEELDSRIALDENDKVVWSEGDEVSIFEGYNINSLYKVSSITDGVADFEFVSYTAPEEMVDLGCNYAVYPYDIANTVSTGIITAPIASEITYSKDNAIDKALMVAKSDGHDLNFTNAQGILLLRLNAQIPIKWGKIFSIKLTSTAENKYLSGTATMDYSTSTDGKPVAKITANGSTYLNVTLADDLQLLLPGTENGEYADYYIPMVPGTYEAGKLTLTVTFEGNKTYTTTNSKDVTIPRSRIQPLKHTLGAGEFTGEIEGLYKVQSAEDLLKWAWLVNNEDNTLGLKLENDIDMPLFTIEEDAANKTYKFTETPITVENGVPSGSNWISLTPNSVGNGNYFRGEMEGNYKTIKGLRIIGSEHTCGFIGYMQGGGYIKNLTFDDAVVYSTYGYVGTAVGYSQDGPTVENVHVTNSIIKGSSNIGGVVGYNYRRIKTGTYDEELAYITNCSTDKNTIVVGTSSIVGGICGSNYGAVMYNCVNNADVTGKTHVAGIAGHSRDYWINVNGYVVACGTTKEATITATDGDAGGLVGYSVKDTNHENSVSYIVACYSLSTISAKNAGTMIGYNANGSATATWAKKNSINRYAGFFKLEDDARNASEHFSSASEITEEFVNEMNAAIENYNATEGVEQQCEYRWKYVANDWPILTK